MEINVIITGATGMVGEGVLLECLNHPDIKQVLLVSRRPYHSKHPKLKECIVPDFFHLDNISGQFTGYHACFYCAGASVIGKNEAEYTHITYDTTMYVAQKLLSLNSRMIFTYVSGSFTDSTEKGKVMWARVKGKTENDLMKLPFKRVYNFRPGFMKPTPGQKNLKWYFKLIGGMYPLLRVIIPNQVNTLREVGQAMIKSVQKGYSKQILEIKDIKLLAQA